MELKEGERSVANIPVLLFVDDEVNILSALKRLFRPAGYKMLTAESGSAGLEILKCEAVDLVISDMRMPGMTGAQFLTQVREKWPDVMRILLTGHSDIGATIEAINSGEIYRYIAKPWDDNEIVLIVRQALERKWLNQEKRRLEALTQRQNEELKVLNADLEDRVALRTQALSEALEKLKKNFVNSVRIFSELIELREGSMAGHSRRVAEHARRVARYLGLDESETQNLFFAGLLHDIGKIGLSDSLLKKPYSALTAEELAELYKHPAIGQTVLMGLDQLSEAARLIRWHHERFDGKGYPDGLNGTDIPLGARILAVVSDYDDLQNTSILVPKPLSTTAAQGFLQQNRGIRYDPQIVDEFLRILRADTTHSDQAERALKPNQLRSGMILTRNFESENGILLLSKDYILTERIIEQIHNYAELIKKSIVLYVRA
jgi:response regulator RpfG family c-di-GMP phosphodiesterase